MFHISRPHRARCACFRGFTPEHIDEVFALDDVDAALAKVAAVGSKGKTVLKIS